MLPFTRILSRQMLSSQMALWFALLLISLAETVTLLVVPVGLAFHALLLALLLIWAAQTSNRSFAAIILTLSLAPLIRILALALPLAFFPPITWYAIIGAPLLLATVMVARQLGLNRIQLGLRFGNPGGELLIGFGGLLLGVLEYAILRPNPLLTQISWLDMLVAALILLVATGFLEEFLFRGLMQAVLLPVLGQHRGMLYISLLFAVLHIGYGSLLDIGFVFVVGLIFALIVARGRSLFGVTFAHGLTNITLFIIAPVAASAPQSNLSQSLPWAVALSSGLFLLGLIRLVAWPAKRELAMAAAD